MADLKLPRLNKVIISGRITHDIELKYTPKGTPVVRFALASDRAYKDEAGTWQNVTSFIDVVAWTLTAENIAKNAHKGSAVIVEGRIDTRTYVDNNNQTRKITEIVAESIHHLEWKPRTEGDGEASSEPPMPEEAPTGNVTSDDVPF